ncbi:Proteasome 26S non-ATPase subunit 12, partial [Operophtera brumata]
MVQECYTYVDNTPDKDTKIKLIETLRTITEGKIYVEVERARLTHILAKMREEENNVAEAAKIIQELQVETYGSMDKREKVELILEQMRLCLAIKDYELKEKFYRLMIAVDQHNSAYLSVCRHFRALGQDAVTDALVGSVVFLILAPYDNEQSDLTHRVNEDKELDKLPEYKQLLGLFINPEIIRWNILCSTYEKMLRATPYFNSSDEKGVERWNDLKNRVVEHNIRIMSIYYTRISVKRMSELLGLSETETEDALSALVVTSVVRAKIDRPAGVVHFRSRSDPGKTVKVEADLLWSGLWSPFNYDYQMAPHSLAKDMARGQNYTVRVEVQDEESFYIGKTREAKFYERWSNVE